MSGSAIFLCYAFFFKWLELTFPSPQTVWTVFNQRLEEFANSWGLRWLDYFLQKHTQWPERTRQELQLKAIKSYFDLLFWGPWAKAALNRRQRTMSFGGSQVVSFVVVDVDVQLMKLCRLFCLFFKPLVRRRTKIWTAWQATRAAEHATTRRRRPTDKIYRHTASAQRCSDFTATTTTTATSYWTESDADEIKYFVFGGLFLTKSSQLSTNLSTEGLKRN